MVLESTGLPFARQTSLVRPETQADEAARTKAVKLSMNDCAMPRMYTRLLYFWPPEASHVLQDTPALLNSLSCFLSYYPMLAGQLTTLSDGSLQVTMDPASDCVPFCTVTTNEATYASLEATGFDPMQFPAATPFVPVDLFPAPVPELGLPPLRVPLFLAQVTHFADGGAVLGTVFHHALLDGRATFAAVAAWGKLHTSPQTVPATLHDRSALNAITAASEAPVECDMYMSQIQTIAAAQRPGESETSEAAASACMPQMQGRLLKFSDAELASIKAAAVAALDTSSVPWISTADALGAHVWRAATRARHKAGLLAALEADQTLRLGFAVDARRRLDPPLPLEYCGNANIYGVATAPLSLLLDKSAAAAAAAAAVVRRAVNRVTYEHCAQALAWVAAQPEKARIQPSFNSFLGPDWAITSWSGFKDAYAVDFGAGKPARVRLPGADFDGLMIVFPRAPGDGGLEVLMGLTVAAWECLDSDASFRQWREM
ncbi:transferase [Tribonema minus]|uniref:Transferase n=1 Tax=Tribonema minus TaxID=303371 RepID=A0A835Z8P3_9STRA|nr:transferase [Tribonema minus]